MNAYTNGVWEFALTKFTAVVRTNVTISHIVSDKVYGIISCGKLD
jgi:hypothetical protein